MSITIIIKEGRADRDRRIYERYRRTPMVNAPVAGLTRNVDEAHDIVYHLHGEPTDPYMVEGGPERKLAFEKDVERLGRQVGRNLDPEEVTQEWGIKHKEG